MLFPVVHLPKLYGCLPPADGEPATCFRCSAQVGLLGSARRGCVVLVDEGGAMYGEMRARLKSVRPVYQKRITALLTALRKEKRIVDVPVPVIFGSTCGTAGCDLGLTIAATYEPHCLVTPGSCACSPVTVSGWPLAVDIDEFQLSSFAATREETETVRVSRNSYSRERFEREVLDPLLRFTRNVKLFDRQIGRLVKTPNSQVNGNYARTVRWILERFVTLVPKDRRGIFEITTGIEAFSANAEQEVQGRAEVIYRFGQQLTEDFDHPVTIYVRKEGTDQNSGGIQFFQLEHDRFMITDRASVQVGRGFDLLDERGRVRTTVVAPIPDAGAVEQEASRVPLIRNPYAPT